MKRIEDPRFLTGQATFIEDMTVPGMLYAAFLRSPYAHARIKRIDASRVMSAPGVVAVLTGEDAVKHTKALRPHTGVEHRFNEYCMAVSKVLFAGHLVAAVAATDKRAARDAVDLFDVEYEPLPAVVDPEEGAKPSAPILFEEAGTNLVFHDVFTYGDVDDAFRSADLVVRDELILHRYASTPIEKFGCICFYDQALKRCTIWSNNQGSGHMVRQIAGALGLSESGLRLIMPDIGGSYGNKVSLPNTLVTALLSRKTGRPVKYVERERESLMSLAHACNAKFYVEAALTKGGIVTALRTREFWDEGGSTLKAGIYPFNKLSIATGCYRIPRLQVHAYSVLTNKCPSAPNRAVGKPGMVYMLERIMDIAALDLGIDRAEIRFRNFIQPNEFPYTNPTGNIYDSGDYPRTLKVALEKIGYEKLKEQQAALRREGRYIGIGLAAVVQSATHARTEVKLSYPQADLAPASEAAMVKMDPSGKVVVAIGTPSTGQGLETVVAQIVADELGVQMEDVHLLTGFDSDAYPWTRFGGRFSNKFSSVDSGAVVMAARRVRAKLLYAASRLLGAPESQLELGDCKIWVRSQPDRSASVKEVAERVYRDANLVPDGMTPGLAETYVYVSPYPQSPGADRKFRSHVTFANSTHVPVVEVDIETGAVKILRYVIVEDCGNMINPMIVDGQIQGAAVHGVGATLSEEFVYDEDGQLLSATFMDYLKPTTMEAPIFEIEHLRTPSPFTVLGVKGVGESGSIPSPAALSSAVEDALAPFKVNVNRLPLSPENVHRMIREAKQRAQAQT